MQTRAAKLAIEKANTLNLGGNIKVVDEYKTQKLTERPNLATRIIVLKRKLDKGVKV